VKGVKMDRVKFILFIFLFFAGSIGHAKVLSQWRGPQRDGIYSAKNLAKQWPQDGPKMLWSFEGLGQGHGAVAVANNKIYVAGMTDSMGVLYALDFSGSLLWKNEYDLEWNGDYPGSRSSATIVDNHLYLESGRGVVTCFDATIGKKIWFVDMIKHFNAENIRWGMAESILIDGDNLICTPGGPQHNIVALNRFSGKTVWTSPGNGEQAAYCSPIFVNHNGTKLIVTMTAKSIIGIDASSGEFYWRVPQNQSHNIHANTPVYVDGKILCSSSSAKTDPYGLVLLELSSDGKSIKELWRNQKFTNLMGGIIIRDGFAYGARYRKSEWYCINLKTGNVEYIFDELGGGVIAYADGLFYCYSDKGQVALVDANSTSFKVVSVFDVPLGSDQHWAHPVIKDGRMYIRHGDALMVYDVSK
jgi:outer membrane protein assembly factor BamB